MPEERRISPAVAIVGAGLGLGVLGTLALVALAWAAPPEEPEPGLANLYGKVTDAETGNPIPDVLVTLDGMQTYTDTAGSYAFTDLEPGGYYIIFQKEGYEMASRDHVLVEGNNELNVAMTPIVVLAKLFGTVTNADTGEPLAGVGVGLWSPDELELLLHTYTDSSGYYEMGNILPGNYVVYFEKDGYESVKK